MGRRPTYLRLKSSLAAAGHQCDATARRAIALCLRLQTSTQRGEGERPAESAPPSVRATGAVAYAATPHRAWAAPCGCIGGRLAQCRAGTALHPHSVVPALGQGGAGARCSLCDAALDRPGQLRWDCSQLCAWSACGCGRRQRATACPLAPDAQQAVRDGGLGAAAQGDAAVWEGCAAGAGAQRARSVPPRPRNGRRLGPCQAGRRRGRGRRDAGADARRLLPGARLGRLGPRGAPARPP